MSLSTPAARRHIHSRRIAFQGYEREDGLYDIEATIVDDKPIAVEFPKRGRIEAGVPLHDMQMRVTIDAHYTVRDIEVNTDAAPQAPCYTVAEAYKALIGANLARGFRRAVEAAVGGTRGCTHLRELLMPLASAAFQTLSGKPENMRRFAPAEIDPDAPLPFFIDACKAWSREGEAVREFYPMYYRKREAPEGA